MILKEDTGELKQELVSLQVHFFILSQNTFQQRKDELIRKHYEKLNKWKDMLADAQVNPPGMSSSHNLLLSLQFAAPRPNPAVPGAAPGPAPGGPGVPMPGPGGQTPHGSFVPGEAGQM